MIQNVFALLRSTNEHRVAIIHHDDLIKILQNLINKDVSWNSRATIMVTEALVRSAFPCQCTVINHDAWDNEGKMQVYRETPAGPPSDGMGEYALQGTKSRHYLAIRVCTCVRARAHVLLCSTQATLLCGTH